MDHFIHGRKKITSALLLSITRLEGERACRREVSDHITISQNLPSGIWSILEPKWSAEGTPCHAGMVYISGSIVPLHPLGAAQGSLALRWSSSGSRVEKARVAGEGGSHIRRFCCVFYFQSHHTDNTDEYLNWSSLGNLVVPTELTHLFLRSLNDLSPALGKFYM